MRFRLRYPVTDGEMLWWLVGLMIAGGLLTMLACEMRAWR